MNLKELGWGQIQEKYQESSELDDLFPGRVVSLSGRHYIVKTLNGELKAVLSNSYLNSVQTKTQIPAVGDWVGLKKNPKVDSYHIIDLYQRKNKLSRKVAGKKSEEQIIASNIDYVFIVTTVDADFNLRRLERYLTMVYEIKAKPVILLNKIDKTENYNAKINELEKICNNVPIIPISADKGTNIESLSEYLKIGITIILIGSSGVGKSTLINQLLGYTRQKVGETRDSDDKGRHITTNRELIMLPEGGMIIDNPGIRELQLWSSGNGISELFNDINEISKNCKYKDCMHEKEPMCAVKKAVKDGQISAERFENYKKLMREQEYIKLRKNTYERRKKDKQFGKMTKKIVDIYKYKGKYK
jgi:ribosome biogenesis GTPase